MKIVIASVYHISSYPGGNEAYSDTLARELVKLGHEVWYVCQQQTARVSLPYHLSTFATFGEWKTFINRLKPDLVHTTGAGVWLTVMGIWCRRHHIPRVDTFQAPLNTDQWWRKPLLLDEWLTIQTAQRVIVTSPLNARYLLRYGQKRKIETVLLSRKQNFIPTRFSQVKAKQLLRLDEAKKYIIMVARLDHHHYYKGVDVALKSLQYVSTRYCLLLCGDGEMKDVYMRQAKKLKVADRVLFLGYVDDQQLPLYYRASVGHIMPSTSTSEGFGLVLLEAMISKVPTITTRVVGISSLLKKYHLSKVIPEDNAVALARAIKQLGNNQMQIESAYQFALQSTAGKMANETVRVYEHTLSE